MHERQKSKLNLRSAKIVESRYYVSNLSPGLEFNFATTLTTKFHKVVNAFCVTA